MNDKDLSQAEYLYKSRRFADVIRRLEPQVFLYRDNPRFYFLLGMSCVYTGDIGGASSFLRRANQLVPEDMQVELALAALALRRRDPDEALRRWLRVLDLRPRDRHARKGLALLKKIADDGSRIDDDRMRGLLPRPGFVVPRWVGPLTIVAIIAAAAVLVLPRVLPRVPADAAREGVEVVEIADSDEVVSFTGQAAYILTEREIRDLLSRLGDYFNDFRDNLVRREGNRLLLSNASESVKERVITLLSYLRVPDFTNFSDGFSYAEVAREPALYRGCFIRWSGAVSNLVFDEDGRGAGFLFLVGFHEGRVVEGQVPVRIDFAAALSPGAPIELIGEVVPDAGQIAVRGTSLRLLRPAPVENR